MSVGRFWSRSLQRSRGEYWKLREGGWLVHSQADLSIPAPRPECREWEGVQGLDLDRQSGLGRVAEG